MPVFIESNISSSENKETQKWYISNDKGSPIILDIPTHLNSMHHISEINNHNCDAQSISKNPIIRIKDVIITKGWYKVKDYFLPFEYPHSVTSDYFNFYSWIFLQNIAGSCTYVMSMDALLTSVGVSSSSFGWAAAITWVLKDGLGSIGMIVYTKIKGESKSFDADILKSKFTADLFHNLGVAFELLTLPFPHLFLLLGSSANVFKGLAGLTNGACKASINKQMAKFNNMGDVTAKGHTQGLLAYILGLGLGIGINLLLPLFVSIVPFYQPYLGLWSAFTILSTIHLICGYKSLRALILKSLNTQRSYLTIRQFLENKTVMTPEEFSKSALEPILPFKKIRTQITIGSSIEKTFKDKLTTDLMESLISLFKEEKFFIYGDKNNMNVLLHREIDQKDILKALFMCMFIKENIEGNINFFDLDPTFRKYLILKSNEEFNDYIELLKEKGWDLNNIIICIEHHRVDWTLKEVVFFT